MSPKAPFAKQTRATLRQNLLRLAYISEAFGGKPSDRWDGRRLNKCEAFCLDEAALKVLSEVKADMQWEAEAEAKAKAEAGKKNGNKPGGKGSDNRHEEEHTPSVSELMKDAQKARRDAQKKAILKR